MQSQLPTNLAPERAVSTLSLAPQLDVPPTDRQMAELHEAWLDHQVNPLGAIQNRGVAYSALND